jgi:hypothetical protein
MHNMFRSLVAIGALLAALHAVAFSGGSPVCTVDTATMNQNMGTRSGSNPGWIITAQTPTYFPGQTSFDVQISNPAFATFKGLLLWATDATGAQVGTWQTPSSNFQLRCNNQSLTHQITNQSLAVKDSPSEIFKLVLPISVRGQITINAFVVQSTRTRHYEMTSTHVHTDPLRNDLDIDTSVTVAKYHALTDGVLVIRYLLGLSGTTLTAGAKSSAAIRTDAEIKTQLDALRANGKLDVDGSGQPRPETDGLLILRYMLGYRDASLIAGINGGTLSATQIQTNIAALLP